MIKTNIPKIQKQTAVKQAIEFLRHYILKINEQEIQKLPSEAQLASELGVSRLTVREALTVLENEGYITRSQGSSTVVTTFARKLTGKIDCVGELGNFIKGCGYKAKVDNIFYTWEPCTEEQAEYLNINPGDELLVLEKRFLADSTPAAYCINRIPRAYLDRETFEEDELGEHIFSFIERTCNVKFSHDFMQLVPSIVDEKIGEILNLKKNTPLLRFDITKYTDDGQPIMFNSEYYVHDLIKFTACRTISYN